MKIKKQKMVFLLVMFSLLISLTIAQEKAKAKTGEEMEIVGLGFEKKPLSGAEIIKATVNPVNPNGELVSPNERPQFEVKLKSRVVTNSQGEFVIEIPDDQFNRIPEGAAFELRLKIKPPEGHVGIYARDEAKTKLNKQQGPKYTLVLFWIQESTRTNKGTFAVSSKAQT